MSLPRAISRRLFAGAFLPLFLGACSALDSYESRFAVVSIGDTRAQLMAVMRDAPSDRKLLDFPLISVEQLVWKSLPNRVFVVQLAFDRVVAKSTVQ